MKTYHMIDTRDRDFIAELKHYTFEQLKAYFDPDEFVNDLDDGEIYRKKWEAIKNLYDLEEYLKWEYGGDAVPFKFREDEVESLEEMERANRYFARVK